jgi:IMP cyclohydrolase
MRRGLHIQKDDYRRGRISHIFEDENMYTSTSTSMDIVIEQITVILIEAYEAGWTPEPIWIW